MYRALHFLVLLTAAVSAMAQRDLEPDFRDTHLVTEFKGLRFQLREDAQIPSDVSNAAEVLARSLPSRTRSSLKAAARAALKDLSPRTWYFLAQSIWELASQSSTLIFRSDESRRYRFKRPDEICLCLKHPTK